MAPTQSEESRRDLVCFFVVPHIVVSSSLGTGSNAAVAGLVGARAGALFDRRPCCLGLLETGRTVSEEEETPTLA